MMTHRSKEINITAGKLYERNYWDFETLQHSARKTENIYIILLASVQYFKSIKREIIVYELN